MDSETINEVKRLVAICKACNIMKGQTKDRKRYSELDQMGFDAYERALRLCGGDRRLLAGYFGSSNKRWWKKKYVTVFDSEGEKENNR